MTCSWKLQNDILAELVEIEVSEDGENGSRARYEEVNVSVKKLTKRMGYLPIGGGALNASYTFVDAVANLCSQMGNAGYVYGRDYYWAYHGHDDDLEDCVTLCVKDDKNENMDPSQCSMWISYQTHC